jgi:glycosyltransferase involved in cell wall biosynthesis
MITTIIPCYNAAPYLSETLDSVLAQTRPVDEIIVVDDCSTDESREIACRYPVKLLQTARNSGHATARNLGIAAAQGGIIAWLDADDYWEPNHLEVVAGLLDRFPEAAVAFSTVQLFGNPTDLSSIFPRQSPCNYLPAWVFWESLVNTIVPAMSAIVRREALLEIGGYSTQVRIAPDFDLWLRLSRRYRFVSTPQITSNYRIHNAQISCNRFRQTQSVYESRARFLRQVKADGDKTLAEVVEQQMRTLWGRDLRRAWTSRNSSLLQSYLSMEAHVPDGATIGKRYRWLRRVRLPFLRPAQLARRVIGKCWRYFDGGRG